MPVHYRPMEAPDISACVEIIARHPILAPRYGKTIRDLAAAWLKLVGADGFIAAVFEDASESQSTILGAGIAVFVTDYFVRELKTAPHFWIGRELTTRICQGESPVLSAKQVREANSSGGLNIAVWQRGVLPEKAPHDSLSNVIMSAFVEMHRGFLIKELVVQAEAPFHVDTCRATGAGFWNARRREYEEFPDVPRERFMSGAHVIGMSRSRANSAPGAWAASPFLYRPPQFCFSRGEQRLITCAMTGRTDEELAQTLGISVAAVRKTWRAIYDRVSARSPELIGNVSPGNGESSERGKEKKHHLLAYLREHPEELRPISRRVLQKTAPARATRN